MAKEKKIEAIEPKLIDIEGLMNGTVKMDSITYRVLMADALARKSRAGIKFLREQQAIIDDERKITKGKNAGKVIKVRRSLAVYRAKYLHDFTDYKTKNELASEQKTIINRNKEIAECNDLADLALSMLDEKD